MYFSLFIYPYVSCVKSGDKVYAAVLR